MPASSLGNRFSRSRATATRRSSRLRPRDAWRQPAEDGEVVLVVLGLLFRRKRDGHPQGAVVGQVVKRLRHDADDHVRAVVEANGASDHGRIGREALHEEAVTQHDDAVAARAVLVGAQHATVQRRHAEQLEEPARDPAGQHALGLRPVGDVQVGVVDGGQVREHVGRRGAPVDEVAHRDIAGLIAPELGDKRDPLGFGKRQRPQHDRVDHAEDGRGRADAQRDGQHGGGGEAGGLAELPEPGHDVLSQVGKPVVTSARAASVCRSMCRTSAFTVRDAAEGADRLGTRVGLAPAALDQFGRPHLDVEPQLVVGVPVGAAPPEANLTPISFRHDDAPTAPSSAARWRSTPSTRPPRSDPSWTPRGAAAGGLAA